MFTKSAAIYDAVYGFKAYAAEAARLIWLVESRAGIAGGRLLDVACGTGGHLPYLRERFEVEGVDLDPAMIEIARAKLPDVPFHVGDMTTFDLGRRFDVVCCLFSSIGYVRTPHRLAAAVARMAGHLADGGVLLIEPWFTPDTYYPGRLSAAFVDLPELKVARMNVARVERSVSVIDFHYLVGTPQGIDRFVERHELGLFTADEYAEAFRAAGLSFEWAAEGLAGGGERGLLIGRKGVV